MTSVHIDMRAPDGSAPPNITLTFTPTRRLGGVGLVPTTRVRLTDGQGGVELLPTDDPTYGDEPWSYRVGEFVGTQDGVYRYVLVPTSTETVEYDALVETGDPGNGQPDPVWWARMDLLEQEIAAGQLTGPQGPAGADGATGLSAYQLAVLDGFVGTEADWLASLVGPTGPKGDTGPAGAPGPAGTGGLPFLGILFNVADYGALGDGVNDDFPAFLAAHNAMAASPYGNAHVLFPTLGPYRMVLDGKVQSWAGGQYAAVPISSRASDASHPKLSRGLVGVGEAYVTRSYPGAGNTTALNLTSTTLVLEYTTPFTWSPSFGHPSFIGAPDADHYGGFTNIHYSVEHITFRQPADPSLCGVNLETVSTARIFDFAADVNVPLDTSPEPTHPTGVPLLMPRTGNAINGSVRQYLAWGYYAGFPINEHCDAESVEVVACKIGMFFRRSNFSHPANIRWVSTEECPWGLAGYDPSGVGPNLGVVDCPNWVVKIDFWHHEDFNRSGSATWMDPSAAGDLKAHVFNPGGQLKGSANFMRVVSTGSGEDFESARVTGAAQFSLIQLANPAVAVTRLTGGTPANPPSGPPNTPTIGTATAGNTTASVGFTPAATGPGAASYTATSTPGGKTGTGTSSPVLVSGLTNGTAYTFTVHATNAAGSSAESASSNAVTPAAGGTTTYVSDDFNRSPGAIGTATTGQTWADHSTSPATWTIAGNQAVYDHSTATGGSYSPVVVDTGHTDGTTSARYVLTSDGGGGDQGLVVRYVDTQNFIMADVSGNNTAGWKIRVFERVGNVFTGKSALTDLTGVTSSSVLVVTIVKSGSTITTTYTVDGGSVQSLGSFTCDAALLSSTLDGLVSESGQKFTIFDNFSVTS